MGAALVPSCLRSFSGGDGAVTFYSLSPAIPYRDIVLIRRKEQYLSRPAEALAGLLRQLKLP